MVGSCRSTAAACSWWRATSRKAVERDEAARRGSRKADKMFRRAVYRQNTVFLYSLLPINFAEKQTGSVFTPFSVPLSISSGRANEQAPISSGLILLPTFNPRTKTNPVMSPESVKWASGDPATAGAVPLLGHRRRCSVPFHLSREVVNLECIEQMQGAGLFALGVRDLLPTASAAALARPARAGLTPALPLQEL